ncbi:MAG TPA: transposase, partial [Longimicrobiales bacterium]|nr:transposase [Longimicrobiales bacterium]
MRVSVGIDIAKEVHWVTAMDERAEVLLDRKLPNTPEEIGRLIEELHELRGPRTVGIDVVGGIAA